MNKHARETSLTWTNIGGQYVEQALICGSDIIGFIAKDRDPDGRGWIGCPTLGEPRPFFSDAIARRYVESFMPEVAA